MAVKSPQCIFLNKRLCWLAFKNDCLHRLCIAASLVFRLGYTNAPQIVEQIVLCYDNLFDGRLRYTAQRGVGTFAHIIKSEWRGLYASKYLSTV